MDANELHRLKREWSKNNWEDYAASVKQAYLDHGYELTDKTISELGQGGMIKFVRLEDYVDLPYIKSREKVVRNQYETWLPFLLDEVFENPFLKTILIPLKHLTGEFVTKSVLIPERVCIRIDLQLPDNFDDVVDLEILRKFTGVQNLKISLYYDDRLGEILSELPNLKHLCLMSEKMIKEFPKLFNTNLKTLEISGSEIAEIPDDIKLMKTLEHLSISSMQLTKLSPEILKLTDLRLLRIFETQINDISLLGKMKNLKVHADPRRIKIKPDNFDLEKMKVDYFNSKYYSYNFFLQFYD